jgi:hypothetical protein
VPRGGEVDPPIELLSLARERERVAWKWRYGGAARSLGGVAWLTG